MTTSKVVTSVGSQPIHNGKKMDSVIPSGFPQMKVFIVYNVVILCLVYYGSIVTYGIWEKVFSLPAPAEEFCNDGTRNCSRPDLFAFEVASGFAILYCAVVGFIGWHISRAPHTKLPSTPEGRLFGYLKEADLLTAASVAFQLWDFVISVMIPEQCQPIMLAHHLLSALVSWYGLNNQYFHYYAIFFLGCSEISTIPLVFLDIAKFYPPDQDSFFATVVNTVAGPLFAVTFFYYRVFLWWKVSYVMWNDIIHVLANGKAEKLRPGRNHILYVMCVGNVLLGILQLYWFGIIVQEARKVLNA